MWLWLDPFWTGVAVGSLTTLALLVVIALLVGRKPPKAKGGLPSPRPVSSPPGPSANGTDRGDLASTTYWH